MSRQTKVQLWALGLIMLITVVFPLLLAIGLVTHR